MSKLTAAHYNEMLKQSNASKDKNRTCSAAEQPNPDQTGGFEPDVWALTVVAASKKAKPSPRHTVLAIIAEYLKQLDEAGYEIKKKG